MITHENLGYAVYQSVGAWACPNGENCDCDCRECSERLVKEYENALRAESLAEALKPYDAESVEDLVRNVRNKTIEEIINSVDEINNQGLHCMEDYCDDDNHDCAECMAKAILRMLERMEEGGEE